MCYIYVNNLIYRWITHWGEKWAGKDTKSVVNTFKHVVENKWSFAMYMVYGGSNFGLNAGANIIEGITAF